MNSVSLLGRLARDPEQKTNAVKFTVAVDRLPDKEGKREADFISCVAFGKTGEIVAKYFHKGKPVAVTGRIQTGSYTNKDGVKVYTTDVIAERVGFVPTDKTAQADEKPDTPATEFARIDDDDVPF